MQAANAPASPTNPVRNATDGELIDGDWRLYAPMFAMLPRDGYPIKFLRNGQVETKNLSGITKWTLRSGETLELYNLDGTMAYQLRFDATANVFYHRFEKGSYVGNLMLIGPSTANFTYYAPPE
jgi:hypothetical protein